MTRKANILLTFDEDVLVTLSDDGSWEASGDPKGVLEEDEGKWQFNPTAGTSLSGAKNIQVTLVGWRLSTATQGQQGDAYRFPKLNNELGNYKVIALEDF
nr:hypothetical protein [uncultured Achromobacter sp.]